MRIRFDMQWVEKVLIMDVPVKRPVLTQSAIITLVKDTVADRLRAEIASGGLAPGIRVIEGYWARRFGVAQASIREAINLLAQEGFVTKASGRSARVVNLTEQDVLQIYELRGALEGLAARLLAMRPHDIQPLELALEMMRRASKRKRPSELIEADLKFHLELCRLSNNSYVFDHARRVLLPLFAFVRIRVISSGQDTSLWGRDFDAHQRIVDLVKEGHGEVAEAYVHRMMARFASTAYENWEKKPAVPSGVRKPRKTGGRQKRN
ncbi:MAG TPA: GntR family transcriptional regulator [Terracidiphilus sp.]|jgi:DNA-binding GntR family transcriptional regulator